jgi:diguanylate cyclase (GGDEF)-like protein/PAS domain S-box-containing protein
MMAKTTKPSLSQKLTSSHLTVAAIGVLALVFAVAVNYQLTARVAEMTNYVEPQDQAASKLLVGLNRSLAALRGWVSLNEPAFSAQWRAAWDEEIDPAFAELKQLTSAYPIKDNQQILQRLKPLLDDLDESQWWVISVAQTPGNYPAQVFFEQNVQPSAQIVIRVLKDLETLAIELSSSQFTGAILSISRAFDELFWSINRILTQGNPDWENDLIVLQQKLEATIRYAQTISPNEAEQRLEILQFETTALVSLSKQSIDLRLSPEWNRAKTLMETETVPLAKEVTALVELLAAKATARVNEYGAQTARDSNIINFIMIFFVMAVMMVAWVVARFRSRDIAMPIVQLEKAATDFRDGKLDHDIHINGTQELESLSSSFNDMRNHLELSRQSLFEANEKLEERVRTRTQELALANQMLDQVHEAAYLADESGRFQYVNKEASRMLGYTHEQLLKLQVIDVDGEDSTDEDWALAWANARDQGSVIFESIHVDIKGKQIPVEINATYIEFEESEYVLGLVRDLTERKKVEESIRSQQLFISAIAETSPALIYVYDLDKQSNVYSNSGVERLLGYSVEEIQAMGENLFINTLHPDDLSKALAQNSKILSASDDEILSVDYRMKHKNGNWKYLHSDERVFIRKPDGSVKQKIGISVDVTEQKETELKLLQAVAVFSSTAEGIAITDTDGVILDVNHSFCEITGYTRDEVIGENPRILKSGRHDQEFYKTMWRSLQETGHWRGEIWNRNKNGTVYPELLNINAIKGSDEISSGYVAAFSDISMMKETEDRLDYLAHHDALTDLPNRLLFNKRLRQSVNRAKKNNETLAVVFVDLDRFKNVNDSLGHQHGDELLKQVSNLLVHCIRREDTLARISGDEFVILLEDIPTVDDATVVVDKIMQAFDKPHSVLGTEVRMTCSIGISLFPNDGDDATVLMRNADAAMYRSKEEGRNTYHFYSEDMTSSALEHILFENALREAIKNEEFFLVFQPQYRLNGGKLVGMEALLRWQHPDLGLVSPARFITIAEHSGQIREIGNWVLMKACEQGKKWLDAGYEIGRIAVNVSAQQLQRDNFLDDFKMTLNKVGLPAQHIEIEVTETYLMKSPEQAVKTLRGVKDLGASVSIDDFGTGYSSMVYLKKLPVTHLKIDQSFVRDIPGDSEDVEITRAIIAMAKAINLKVIAEGIENQSQLELLRNIQCDYGQGFLLSLPMKAEEIEILLKRNQRMEISD